MRISWRIAYDDGRAATVLAALALVAFCIPAGGKCLPGVVAVGVQVATQDGSPVMVTARLRTPKGEFAKSASGQSDFTIEVPFSTWSSVSALWGWDRCSNLPTVVFISAVVSGKPVGELEVKFKGNAPVYGPKEYRLRRVVVDAAGVRLEAKEEKGGVAFSDK
jgi:hypothetical protein